MHVSYRNPNEDGPRIGGGVVFALGLVVGMTSISFYLAALGAFDAGAPQARMHVASLLADDLQPAPLSPGSGRSGR